MYDGQVLLQTTKEQLASFSLELYLISNFLTYLCLWKINRKAESAKYLEIVNTHLYSIRIGAVASKLPSISIDNFYGISSYATYLMKIYNDGNARIAGQVCEERMRELGDEVVSRGVVRGIIAKLKNLEKSRYTETNHEINEELCSIFFIYMFVPLMSPKTPDIQLEENVPEFRVFKKVFRTSKRSSSRGSANPLDFYKNRGNSYQYSPSSRPRSGVKAELQVLNVTRPRSSYGISTKPKIKRPYL